MSPARLYFGPLRWSRRLRSTEGLAWLLLQAVAGIRWASSQQSSPRGQLTMTTTSPRSGPPSSATKVPCASNHLHQSPRVCRT
jgi:hypothetical protein